MMDTMDTTGKRVRRNHSAQLKAQILEQCQVPGASVAQVAMAHGINANLVHIWRKLARQHSAQPLEAPAFVPLAIEAAPASPVQPHIDIELRRGAVSMTLNWPLSATAELAGFTRALLR